MNGAPRPVSITTLVAIPLLLFLGVLLLMSILLFFAFRDINAVLGQTVEEKTPFIMHATALIRQSEGLRSMVFRLMQADSYLVWNSLMEQVRIRLAEGRESARALRELGLYPSKVENLQRQMESLSSVVAGTDSFMARWLHAGNARTQLIKSLHSLNGDMEELAERQPCIADWHRGCRLLSQALLSRRIRPCAACLSQPFRRRNGPPSCACTCCSWIMPITKALCAFLTRPGS